MDRNSERRHAIHKPCTVEPSTANECNYSLNSPMWASVSNRQMCLQPYLTNEVYKVYANGNKERQIDTVVKISIKRRKEVCTT